MAYRVVTSLFFLKRKKFFVFENVSHKATLIQIQRIPLLGITKTYRTVSNEAVQVLAGCPPLGIRAIMEKYTLDEAQLRKTKMEAEGLWNFDYQSRIPPWKVKRVKWQFYVYSMKGNDIFTDGSKIDEKVGVAFVYFLDGVEIENRQFRLSDGASVFTAEIMAVRVAIAYSHEKNLSEVRIISDSRSALMALNPLGERRQMINAIKESVNNNIELCWVRAHQGQFGKERAAELAKEATARDTTDYKFNKSCVQLKNDVKKQILIKW
ncbi:hypothetical protein AVEN_71550-1 [Araneus ventricosus]|uniref:ribonuclease H n=1 Tax=Araneus ventricosus TaxID=182803 RepID=A0A4Y2ESX6_ARAVE|nr:hypothetical protein AVEN_71550-1 [Araneus ventricosus]